MLSTPSYFKLKSQLRLAAEHDPSTCIEFELRCNSAASNLRYKTIPFHMRIRWLAVHAIRCTADHPVPHPPRSKTQYTLRTRSVHFAAVIVPTASTESNRYFGTRPISDQKAFTVQPAVGSRSRRKTNLNTAGKRNRRVQPPRSPARVPPVRRSVDSNGTRRNRAAPRLNITNQLSPARDVPPTLARGERHPALRRAPALAYPPRRVHRHDRKPCSASALHPRQPSSSLSSGQPRTSSGPRITQPGPVRPGGL